MKWRYLNVPSFSPLNTPVGADEPFQAKEKGKFVSSIHYSSPMEHGMLSIPLTDGNHESTPLLPVVGFGDKNAMQDNENPSTYISAPNTVTETSSNNLDDLLFFDFSSDLELGSTWTWDRDQNRSTPLPKDRGIDSELRSLPSQMHTEDKSLILTNHYFTNVCPINSCFDSHQNPFRSFVGTLMASSSLVYNIVMTVSASHLCHKDKEMTSLAFRYRQNAISLLAKGRASEKGNLEALLGSILLGMTASWQDAASLGLAHLVGARTLFKKWSTESCNDCPPRSISFVVGIMAYWEAMASFLTAESPETLQYLTKFCDQEHRDDIVFPNPWTGISTTLFIYTAQAGALCRQNRVMRALSVSIASTTALDELYSKQTSEAVELEQLILRYSPPNSKCVEDSGDGLTSIHHLQCLAQVYRFAALLQLYMTFPSLLRKEYQAESSPKAGHYRQMVQETPEGKIIAMAVMVLNLVSSVPESSGVGVLMSLPLIIAGSALQKSHGLVPAHKNAEDRRSRIEHEMLSLHCSDHMLSHWRSLTLIKLRSLHDRVGLGAIRRAMQILEAVWLRADLSVSANDHISEAISIHWMDVMTEERLESVFG
jgi:hypothetical protein